jgi:hypothetical protein
MNMHEREHEERRQAEAEAAERARLPPGADPAVNEYRLVLRALRQPPGVAGLPMDFAARVARRAIYAEERGTIEDWIITGLMLALAVGALVFLQPVMAKIVGAFHISLPQVPWPLLLATAFAVAAAWAVEQGLAHRK